MCLILGTGFADAAIEPIDFPTAPAFAVPKVRNEEIEMKHKQTWYSKII